MMNDSNYLYSIQIIFMMNDSNYLHVSFTVRIKFLEQPKAVPSPDPDSFRFVQKGHIAHPTVSRKLKNPLPLELSVSVRLGLITCLRIEGFSTVGPPFHILNNETFFFYCMLVYIKNIHAK